MGLTRKDASPVPKQSGSLKLDASGSPSSKPVTPDLTVIRVRARVGGRASG